MSKRLLGWVVVLALSTVACTEEMEEGQESQACQESKGGKKCKQEKEREKERERERQKILCEKDDERCEVGDGKCVVGYDDECPVGQVCYAGEGAPKGKQGTCTDGQFDAHGKLTAAVLFRGLTQGRQPILVGQGLCHLAAKPPWSPCEDAAAQSEGTRQNT